MPTEMLARHYGSAFGELTACACRVGVVDRGDLSRVRVDGPGAKVDAVLARLIGTTIAPGGSALVADVWWCRPTTATVLIFCSRDSCSRLCRLLRDEAKRHHGITIRDDAGEHAFVGVVGLRTPAVLRALGVLGAASDIRLAPPCSTTDIAGCEVTWLLESDVSAVACVHRGLSRAVARRIEEAGRPLGMIRVGQDAFHNYRVLERRERHHLPLS